MLEVALPESFQRGRIGVVSRAKNAETVTMKKLVVFDLEGTLAESNLSIAAEM
jgi:hypothetical protein